MRTALWLMALAMLLLGGPLITQPAMPALLLRFIVILPFVVGFVLAVAGDIQELRSGRQ